MVHKPKVYWEDFGRFADKTKAKDISVTGTGEEFKQISVHQRTLQGTSGNDSDKSTIHYGSKYDEQIGHAVGVQEGNKTSIQTGWSNSLLQGFSFSTTLGQSASTTVGNSFSNHTGFKYTGFFGPEMTVLVSMGVKITGTAYWEVAKGGKYETGTTKTYVAASEQRIVDSIIELSTAVYHTIGRLDQKCTTINQAAVDLTQRVNTLALTAGDINNKFTRMQSTGVQIDFTATKLSCTGEGLVTIKSALVRIG